MSGIDQWGKRLCIGRVIILVTPVLLWVYEIYSVKAKIIQGEAWAEPCMIFAWAEYISYTHNKTGVTNLSHAQNFKKIKSKKEKKCWQFTFWLFGVSTQWEQLSTAALHDVINLVARGYYASFFKYFGHNLTIFPCTQRREIYVYKSSGSSK